MYSYELFDGLPLILRGKSFQNVILSLPFEEQIKSMEKLIFDKFDKDTLFSLATLIDNVFSKNMFAT